MKNNFATILFGVFILILFINLSSADFYDWFGKITGRVTTGQTNVSVALNGTNGVTLLVYNSSLGSVSPTEDGTTTATIYIVVNDTDGVSDINDTSVNVTFYKTGETNRGNNSCQLLSDLTAQTANYTCAVSMYYFDSSSTWNIIACARDLGNGTYVCNSTTTFTYNQLQALTLSPNSITWATLTPGGTNQTSNNDPSIVNNTGNYNFTNVTVKGFNLHGEVVTTTFINVANFTVANNTGSTAECDTSPTVNNATVLSNGTAIQIKHSLLTRGNHSVNNGATGQEQLYHCILTVPQVQSQTYSTSYAGGAWIIAGA